MITRDEALHALFGALFAGVSAFVWAPLWLSVGWPVLLGFAREHHGERDLRKWSLKRWREALFWIPGAVIGAAIGVVLR